LEKHKENEEKVLTQQRRLIGRKLVLQGASQKIEPEYGHSQNKIGREVGAQEVLAFGDSLYFILQKKTGAM